MYAVVKTGGKSIRSRRRHHPGGEVRWERGRPGALKDVDGVQRRRGSPRDTSGPQVVVTGEIIQQVKGKKVLVFKMKRRRTTVV